MVVELAVFAATPLFAEAMSRQRSLGWLDPVLTCYGVGLLLANLPIDLDESVTTSVSEVVVPLAIPLLLFGTDFRKWLQGSRTTIIGFFVAVVSAIIGVLAAVLILGGGGDDRWLSAGMLVGAWTGGSPNLFSVATALEAPQETVILTNAADIFVGAFYLLALLTFAKPVLSLWLQPSEECTPMTPKGDEPRSQKALIDGAKALGVAVAILAVSAGLSMLAFGKLSAPAVILGITTGGIFASFVAPIHKLESSYDVGNYLILVFCVAVGALSDLGALIEKGTAFVTFAAIALTITLSVHYFVCRFVRVDTDTAMITSVATIMGPPLVVPVAKRLNSQEAFVSGVTSGLVGYAFANYLGIALANFVRAL